MCTTLWLAFDCGRQQAIVLLMRIKRRGGVYKTCSRVCHDPIVAIDIDLVEQ